MDKYLIVGLGNPGSEYAETRHNTGFMVLDAFAKASNKENIDQQRMIVVVDDVALPLGTIRMKAGGNNGGHNGLGHIQQLIGSNYPRLRMGIGNDFPIGGQINWVLGTFDDEEKKVLQPAIDTAGEAIKSFVLAGINITMNQFNKKPKQEKQSPETKTTEQPTTNTAEDHHE